MAARVLYVDPHMRSRATLDVLRRDGIECVSLREDLKDIIEFMLAGDDLLLVSADDLVKMPMVAAASSLMTVVAYIPPVVEGTQWLTMPSELSSEQEADLLKGLLQRGAEGRRRTRIPLECRLWVKGVPHQVTNASVRELWLSTWRPNEQQAVFDGVLELSAEHGSVNVVSKIVARRDDGCAVHISPVQDIGLLTWLDYFSEVLNQTPENERIELVKEYFDDT